MTHMTHGLWHALAEVEILQEASDYDPAQYEIPAHSMGADLVRRLAITLRAWIKLAEDEKRARDNAEKRRARVRPHEGTL
jgi:hypothetical protein